MGQNYKEYDSDDVVREIYIKHNGNDIFASVYNDSYHDNVIVTINDEITFPCKINMAMPELLIEKSLKYMCDARI